MKNKKQKHYNTLTNHFSRVTLVLIVIAIAISIVMAAEPEGATVTFKFNSNRTSTASPGSRTDPKGSINTVNLDSESQNMKWKAYVGNVSSTFVLQDASNFTIYQWEDDPNYAYSGQVYITRDNSISWSTVGCASPFNKSFEDQSINHDPTGSISVNKTFNDTIHQAFTVGDYAITASQCYSTMTWQNDSYRYHVSGLPWEEVLLWDNSSNAMIYTTFVEDNLDGYNNDSTYDFQAIVPDDGNLGNPALTYYFYLEVA